MTDEEIEATVPEVINRCQKTGQEVGLLYCPVACIRLCPCILHLINAPTFGGQAIKLKLISEDFFMPGFRLDKYVTVCDIFHHT